MSVPTKQLFWEMTESNPEDRIESYDQLIVRIDELLSCEEADSSDQHVPNLLLLSEDSIERRRTRDQRQWLAIPVCSLIFVFVFTAVIWFTGDGPVTEAVATNWTTTGLAQPVFNGVTVPIELQESGTWLPQAAPDGSRVLAGASGGRLVVPLVLDTSDTLNVRLRVGVYIPADGTLEVEASAGDVGTRSVRLMHLTPTSASGLEGLTQTSDSRSPIEIEAAPPENVVFQRLVVSRQNDRIVVSVNGSMLGHATVNRTQPTVIRFHCVGGSINFADFDVVELVPTT